MTAPFALSTGDPRFDPREPVTINGYLYIPADAVRAARKPVVHPTAKRKVVVDVKRKREVARG